MVTQVVGMCATHLKDVSVILIQQYVSRPSSRAVWFIIIIIVIIISHRPRWSTSSSASSSSAEAESFLGEPGDPGRCSPSNMCATHSSAFKLGFIDGHGHGELWRWSRTLWIVDVVKETVFRRRVGGSVGTWQRKCCGKMVNRWSRPRNKRGGI